MSQVSMGEQLAIKGMSLVSCSVPVGVNTTAGPDFHLASAMSFYRALRVYPSPVELIVIYQKTVPEPIFKVDYFPNAIRLDSQSPHRWLWI